MSLEARSSMSSNYRKHTAVNPLQRVLIDRFHNKILAEIVALSPRTFLDAGCGEGFVCRRIINAVPDAPRDHTYRRRFGSLGAAYALVGYAPDLAQMQRFKHLG